MVTTSDFAVGRWVLGCVALLSMALACPAAVIVEQLRDKPDSWFATDEGKATIANIITWQNANGGWWKSYDTSKPRPETAKSESTNPAAPKDDWSLTSTFDNQATYTELRLLARAASLNNDEAAKAAFLRGLGFIFASQYENGGWPQRFPLENNYGRHITFNDGGMAGVMKLLRETAAGEKPFDFVDQTTRESAKASFQKGVDCILKCQVKVGDTLTAWCQQHDEVTFAPQYARAYELPSICSTESAELTLLLMDLQSPDESVRRAVDSAVTWFEKSQIQGKRYDRITGPDGKVSRVLSDDPAAPPLWARFYDIESNRPFFCDRDGVKKWDLNEVGEERRRGYAWYSTSPNNVLKKYPAWKARVQK